MIRKFTLISLLAIGLAQPTYAREPILITKDSPTNHVLAKKALAVSLVPEVMGLLEVSFRQRINEDPRVTREQQQILADLLIKSMNTQGELSMISEAVSRESDIASLNQFVEAYSTPTATKLNAMSLKASEPTELAKLKNFVSELEAAPIDTQRARLVLRLDELTEASKMTGEFMLAMATRLARTQPGTPRYQQLADKVMEQARDQSFVMTLFSFQTATTEEIAAFVSLHENPQVAKVAKVILREMMHGIQNMTDRALESVFMDGAAALSFNPTLRRE